MEKNCDTCIYSEPIKGNDIAVYCKIPTPEWIDAVLSIANISMFNVMNKNLNGSNCPTYQAKEEDAKP